MTPARVGCSALLGDGLRRRRRRVLAVSDRPPTLGSPGRRGRVPFRIVAADGVDVRRASWFAAARSHRAGLRSVQWLRLFLSSSFFSTQRESSAARAHDSIGAGRLKRLFGVRFVVVALRAAWVADAACAGSAARLCRPSLPRRRAARASCGLMVRYARLTPWPRRLPPRPSLSSVVLSSFFFHRT